MSQASADKAHRYLIEGRVQVMSADDETAWVEVHGSDSEPYVVRFAKGVWWCNCPARKPLCAHVVAARLVSPLRAKVDAIKLGEPGELDDWFVRDAENGLMVVQPLYGDE